MGERLGYVRVSTSSQDLDSQRLRLQSAVVERVFEDVVSGSVLLRTGLTELLSYARAGDTVVVVRLDRLGRTIRQLLDTVELLKQRGIGLVSLEESIDTTTAAGELIFHVFSSLAHFERRLISERTRDGLAAARINGKKFGRPALDNRKIEAALALVASGFSPTVAASQVGVGRSSLYRELQKRSICQSL